MTKSSCAPASSGLSPYNEYVHVRRDRCADPSLLRGDRCADPGLPFMATQPLNVDTDARYIELDTDRKIRHRNKLYYRFNHWPLWIFVFFIAPGPLTFDLFERGFDSRLLL